MSSEGTTANADGTGRRIRARVLVFYGALSVLATVAWFFVVIVAASIVDSGSSASEPSPGADAVSRLGGAAMAFVLYGVLLGLLLGAMRRRGLRLRDLLGPRPSRQQVTWAVATGAGASALSLATFYASSLVLSRVAPAWLEMELTNFGPLWRLMKQEPVIMPLGILHLVLLTPLVEELFFRGMLLTTWTFKWNARRAILLSSLVFAAIHIDILGAFLFAIVASVCFLRTRMLWLPLLIHIVVNALSYVHWAIQDLFLGPQPATIDALLDTWRLAIAGLIVSLPFLAYAVRSFPSADRVHARSAPKRMDLESSEDA